jgi:hypothetical protein
MLYESGVKTRARSLQRGVAVWPAANSRVIVEEVRGSGRTNDAFCTGEVEEEPRLTTRTVVLLWPSAG